MTNREQKEERIMAEMGRRIKNISHSKDVTFIKDYRYELNLEDILARAKIHNIECKCDCEHIGFHIVGDRAILLPRHLQKPLREQPEETINSLYDLIETTTK